MPSRIRVVYISRNAHRRESSGRLRGDRTKPAVLKFYGKAAICAAEEDAISNWGGGGHVGEVLGSLTYKRATIWGKFRRIEREGFLLGRCWIGREGRNLPPKKSGFVRFLTLNGYETRRKKAQPVGHRVYFRPPQRFAVDRADNNPAGVEVNELGEVINFYAGIEGEAYPPAPRDVAAPAPAQNPPRIGIWN